MTDRQPATVTNLDRYGNPPLPWSRAHDVLAVDSLGPEIPVFLGTVSADGRPHAAGIGVVWFDGDVYLTSGSGTRKSRDLAAQPACTLSIRLAGIDLVLEGEATRVTDAADARAGCPAVSRRRLASRGRGRCPDRALQRPERWPTAVAAVSLRLLDGGRGRERGALRCDPLAIRPLTNRGAGRGRAQSVQGGDHARSEVDRAGGEILLEVGDAGSARNQE